MVPRNSTKRQINVMVEILKFVAPNARGLSLTIDLPITFCAGLGWQHPFNDYGIYSPWWKKTATSCDRGCCEERAYVKPLSQPCPWLKRLIQCDRCSVDHEGLVLLSVQSKVNIPQYYSSTLLLLRLRNNKNTIHLKPFIYAASDGHNSEG